MKPILGCNMTCEGCYEGQVFALNNNRPDPYNLDSILETTARLKAGEVALHGGEILLMPFADLTRLCEGLKTQDYKITVQTNGTLIRDAHLALFKRLGISLGISLNGPGVLNRDRRLGDARSTDATTERIHETIKRARAEGIEVGIICVLSQTNADGPGKLDRLVRWAKELGEEHGIWDFRFNPLHDDSARAGEMELSAEDAAEAYRELAYATFEDPRRHWLPFREFVDNLWGLGIQPCWMSPCDVYATAAVHAVFSDGSEGNCLRTAKDGIPYLRAETASDVRQQVLQQISVEDGGCGGCRYVRVCAGGCPAEGEGGDWRNKSRFCQMYYETYQYIETRLSGLLPNFTPVPDWNTNDEAGLMRSINDRAPMISPINPMLSAWSVRPSTYQRRAREEKR